VAHGFLQEIPFPADPQRGARKIREERGLQQSLEIDRAIVAIGSKGPHELGYLPRAADARTIPPLVRVDRDKPDIQTAELDDDLVLSFNKPVDFRFRKAFPKLGDRRQAMNNVPKRTKFNDEEPVQRCISCHAYFLREVPTIFWITSRVE
jgi:hypothetical protein